MNSIARIKFLIQEYADCQDEIDLDKTAATIIEIAQPPACLYTERQVTCRELSCLNCPMLTILPSIKLDALKPCRKVTELCPRCGADRENYQEEMHAPCCEG